MILTILNLIILIVNVVCVSLLFREVYGKFREQGRNLHRNVESYTQKVAKEEFDKFLKGDYYDFINTVKSTLRNDIQPIVRDAIYYGITRYGRDKMGGVAATIENTLTKIILDSLEDSIKEEKIVESESE